MTQAILLFIGSTKGDYNRESNPSRRVRSPPSRSSRDRWRTKRSLESLFFALSLNTVSPWFLFRIIEKESGRHREELVNTEIRNGGERHLELIGDQYARLTSLREIISVNSGKAESVAFSRGKKPRWMNRVSIVMILPGRVFSVISAKERNQTRLLASK